MIDLDHLKKVSGIVGNSAAIRQVLEMVAQVAPGGYFGVDHW